MSRKYGFLHVLVRKSGNFNLYLVGFCRVEKRLRWCNEHATRRFDCQGFFFSWKLVELLKGTCNFLEVISSAVASSFRKTIVCIVNVRSVFELIKVLFTTGKVPFVLCAFYIRVTSTREALGMSSGYGFDLSQASVQALISKKYLFFVL